MSNKKKTSIKIRQGASGAALSTVAELSKEIGLSDYFDKVDLHETVPALSQSVANSDIIVTLTVEPLTDSIPEIDPLGLTKSNIKSWITSNHKDYIEDPDFENETEAKYYLVMDGLGEFNIFSKSENYDKFKDFAERTIHELSSSE